MSALVPDTTSKTITGKDGTADFTLDDGVNIRSYRCFLDMFRVREVIEMTNADTFCIEGVSDQEPGRSQIVGELSGLGKKGGPSSGPFIPAPQGVIAILTFSTQCTLSFPSGINFVEATCDRLVNANCRISGRFLSKGTYVLSWKLS
jgi:hypothetical protein